MVNIINLFIIVVFLFLLTTPIHEAIHVIQAKYIYGCTGISVHYLEYPMVMWVEAEHCEKPPNHLIDEIVAYGLQTLLVIYICKKFILK